MNQVNLNGDYKSFSFLITLLIGVCFFLFLVNLVINMSLRMLVLSRHVGHALAIRVDRMQLSQRLRLPEASTGLWHLSASSKSLKWPANVVSCHNFAELSLHALIHVDVAGRRRWIGALGPALVSLVHLVAWSLAVAVLVAVANVGLFLALVFLPEPSLILRIEVHHVERVLEVNEEVARILRCVIFCSCKIDAGVSVLVGLVDFLL